jgi:lipid A 3-O-deacylase
MTRAFALIALLLTTVAAAPAMAGDEPARLKLGVGYYDVFDDQNALDVKAEIHSSREWWIVHPWVGLEANSDGGIWGGFGIAADLKLSEQWIITPSTSVGLYGEGDSKDLGGVVQFRSGLELAYKFENAHRLGLELTHMSNASIYDSNPGTEVISVNYHMPLSAFGQ